jgi:hypothetical protein
MQHRMPSLSLSLRNRYAVGRGQALWMCLASGAIGAVVTYFMDHDRGRRRRHVLRDRSMARWRRLGRAMARRWRGAAAETYGISHRVIHLVPRSTEVADDETLRQRVESQLFRDRHIPKGNLNITCEHGMVILRGEFDTQAEIEHIAERVGRVHGVRGVHNLLHPRGTPAPNKARSLSN